MCEPADKANRVWLKYETGGMDRAGRRIDKIYALDDDYIIYFCDCELFYETTPGLVQDLGSTNAALARINRLLPDNPKNKNSYTYRNKFSTLELAADACEMVFCGEIADGVAILNSISDKLQTTEEGKRRLIYQLGAVSITFVVWLFYLRFQDTGSLPVKWQPWVLTAVLAMAGGVFSVCLNLGSLEVSVNQQSLFLLVAGATRSVVALLAGIGLLLAMRSKMFAGIAYGGTPPAADDPLVIAEMFFCFVAGFSESFVPNILRDSEKKSGDQKPGVNPAPLPTGAPTGNSTPSVAQPATPGKQIPPAGQAPPTGQAPPAAPTPPAGQTSPVGPNAPVGG